MGNDGGSIPKRRELVKEAARQQTSSEAKESQQEQQEYKWSTCQISQVPLEQPVVSDYLGNLYNKAAVLEFLLPSEDPAVEALKPEQDKIMGGRVKGLKDLVEVRFESDSDGSKDGERSGSKWICPITNKALGPSVKAAYIVPCGHAFSEIALKEISEPHCLQCSQPFQPTDIVTILPTNEADKKRLHERIAKLLEDGKAHSLKKASGSSKKRKKNGEMKEDNNATNKLDSKVQDYQTNREDGLKKIAASGSNGIKNAATASLTAKVMAEEQEKAKRRRLEPNDNVKSLFTSSEKKERNGKNSDFMTRGFTIPAEARR